MSENKQNSVKFNKLLKDKQKKNKAIESDKVIKK